MAPIPTALGGDTEVGSGRESGDSVVDEGGSTMDGGGSIRLASSESACAMLVVDRAPVPLVFVLWLFESTFVAGIGEANCEPGADKLDNRMSCGFTPLANAAASKAGRLAASEDIIFLRNL